MSLFREADHAANPPETWRVVKVAERAWRLTTHDGDVLGQYPTRTMAAADRETGYFVELYEKERRWYAGEPVAHWRPYAEIKAEQAS